LLAEVEGELLEIELMLRQLFTHPFALPRTCQRGILIQIKARGTFTVILNAKPTARRKFAMAGQPMLMTTAGNPLADNQNSMTAGDTSMAMVVEVTDRSAKWT